MAPSGFRSREEVRFLPPLVFVGSSNDGCCRGLVSAGDRRHVLRGHRGGRTGVIRVWNGAAQALLGYMAAEAVGHSVELVIPDSLRPAHRACYARAVSGARDTVGPMRRACRHGAGTARRSRSAGTSRYCRTAADGSLVRRSSFGWPTSLPTTTRRDRTKQESSCVSQRPRMSLDERDACAKNRHPSCARPHACLDGRSSIEIR
jgi:PAS domain-containing protein